MLLVLPVAAFLSFFLIFRNRGLAWRPALLAAAVFCGTEVVLITEALSTANAVTRLGVSMCWAVVCLAGIAIYRVVARSGLQTLQSEARISEYLNRRNAPLLLGAALVVLLVGVTALIAAPDTWDAMEYHLPRIVMWLSNHNVRFFPTPDYCQLVYAAWSEYAMMHTEVLWGSDRFVNIVEWLSLIGSLVAVSLIAKRLGAGPRGQILAAIVCATIPKGLLEASGPMNTYVVSFWTATSLAFLLEWNEQPNWLNLVCAGLSVTLAVFTKGTAYIFLPFLLLACWLMGSKQNRILLLKRLSVLMVLLLVINGPQYARSYQFTGSPLGLPIPAAYPRTELAMDHVTVRGTLANVLRNASLHLVTPSRAVNHHIENSLRLAIRTLGVNPDDPTQNWVALPFHMNHFTSNEIIAGNPLHFLLLLMVFVLVFWKARGAGNRRAALYAGGIIAAYLLFCALLRWQMWSSRYHLTLFVVGSALIGIVLERYFCESATALIAGALVIMAIFLALTNRSRSLIPWSRVENVYHPRSELYFTNEHESIAPSHIAAANFVNSLDCRNVAIDSYVSDSEIKNSPDSFFVYPILALIHADGRTRSVWYTGVKNLSSRYDKDQHHPKACAVICFDCVRAPEKWKEYKDIGGHAAAFGDVVVFSSRAAPNSPGTPVTAAGAR